MLKMKTMLAVVASSLLLGAGSARANFVTSQVNTAGLENEIHDSSLETVTPFGGATTITPGAVISGTVLYTQIGTTGNLHGIPSSFAGEVTAVFSLTVAAVSGFTPGVGFVLTFVPTPSFEATYGTGAMAALFENDTGKPLTAAYAAGGGTPGTYFADAQAGTLQGIVGFTGPAGTPISGEQWTGTASTLAAPPGTSLTGSYTAYVDLIPHAYASGTLAASFVFPFSEVNPDPTNPGSTQFKVVGSQSGNPNFPVKSPFPVADDSSVRFFASPSPVPEPSSCLLLGIGGAGLVFFRKRFKKIAVG